MIRPRSQPSILDHLLESGFFLWLYSIGHSVIFSFIVYSEWGEILRNEFFPLLLLATILLLANMLLAGIKYGNWLADCDRRQKNVLITLKCHNYLKFLIKVLVIILGKFILFDKLGW
ncbi:hypothetical protein CY0110_14445 [Crocosphaera chwakensis CCY0110]|uniref:Uncharacterized protein n=1 Tax=Crocosphaera chwakensis CCY0110 TaxID=391612 RepID=A3IZ40_9CHRO|nr:hypothetical protein CY0110_14445 [Crocosphaera chwakensis CCY0110]